MRLIFNGVAHIIILLNDDETTVMAWTAYNRIDSYIQGLKFLRNGMYDIIDQYRPHLNYNNEDTENRVYGPYGIIRFNYPGHSDVGVHSGRTHVPHEPGPYYMTNGCIRTTNDAMRVIKNNMQLMPLYSIKIRHNEPGNQDDPANVETYQNVTTYRI